MKKIFLALTIIAASIISHAQKITIMNSVAATTTVTAYTADVSPIVGQIGTGQSGILHIITNAAFNGTTSKDSLFISTDNSNWAIWKDDAGTPITFTMSAGANIYPITIKSAMAPFVKIKYTKGDATLGTVKAILFLR